MKKLAFILILFISCSQTPPKHHSMWIPEVYIKEIRYVKITILDARSIFDTMPEYNPEDFKKAPMKGCVIDGKTGDTIRKHYAFSYDTIVEFVPYDTVFKRADDPMEYFNN